MLNNQRTVLTSVASINEELRGQGYQIYVDLNMKGTRSYVQVTNEEGEQLTTTSSITEALLEIGRQMERQI